MSRRTSASAAALVAAVLTTLTACGGSSAGGASTGSAPVSASSSTTAASTATSGTSASPSSSTATSVGAGVSRGSSSTGASSTKSPTSASAAPGPLDRAIEKFDFDNTTWALSGGPQVTLANGAGTASDDTGAQISYATKPNDMVPTTSHAVYGDLNGDGYEDAVITLGWGAGTGGGELPIVWLGGPKGPHQVTSGSIVGSSSCGDEVDSIRIVNRTIITTGKLLGDSCAAPRTQPFTRSYVVSGTSITQVSGPTPD